MGSPLDSLFGGGGSSSTAETANQQVGAQGNSGPVFGAITTKGGAIKQGSSQSRGGGKKNGKNAASSSGPSMVTNTNATSGSGPTTSPQTASSDAGGGSGNVNISVVSGDSIAETHNSEIATTSITGNQELAGASIKAQNDLAIAALGVANNIAGFSFGLASQTSAQSAQNSSDVAQAGQNLAAIGIGTRAAEELISPTGGEAVEGGTNYQKILIGLSVVGLMVLVFKE